VLVLVLVPVLVYFLEREQLCVVLGMI
jgi:hypothetical protein